MRARTASVVALLSLSCAALAQESAVGKYTGTYTTTSNSRYSITLDIKSVEGGSIQGTGFRSGTTQIGKLITNCMGEFPISGTLKGNDLQVRSEKFGSSGDCTFQLRGTVAGNKIMGKVGPNEFELSK